MTPEQIEEWIASYGYFAIVFGTMWDSSGLQLFVVGGGAFAGVSEKLSLPGVILAGALGNLGTDAALYGVGLWRASWLERVVKSEKGKVRLKLISEGMQHYAWPFLVFGRFMPWFGRFVPAVAGVRRVKATRAFAALIVGGLIAGATYGCIGYFAGNVLKELEGYFFWIVIGLLILSIPVAGWLLKSFDQEVERRLAAKRAQAEQAP